ncbi:MAG TPA: hypothetical protein VH012_01970 [Acidimicrobiales bacterium]|nr:hypothetical protein [Acidimicrobiales bacterium]
MLIAIPTAAFVLPDLIGGHLLITGDNLQQNFPLHVLVGSMFRHGQLPFWNQYIFSGTPLMADFNAGAFYPLTGLFVVLPDRAAWIATEVLAFSAIAVGMYVFLRALKLSTVACFLAALTFAFAGPVLSQVNHVDMTEGFVAIPWMLLAVLHIVRDGRWRWTILLGIAYATVILAGAPEAMLDEAFLIAAFAVASAGLNRERWWRVITRCGAGAALALSLAAIQWLPGLEVIRNSQRGAGVAAAAGSYPRPFGILGLVPYINGGYGHIGEAQFFSQYNLPEVGIYLGILPVIALITLLNPRWPSRIPPRDRLTWYAVGLVGLLLALGSNTPLEHLFNSLPLYGHQRLQSRNMITVATAVCVLFAGWVDRTDSRRLRESMTRYDRIMGLIPAVAVAGLALWAWISPRTLVWTFAGVALRARYANTVREATLIAFAFCAGAAVLVWIRPRLGSVSWSRLAALFVVIDVGLVGVTSQLTQTPPNDLLAGTTPIQKLMVAELPPGARMVNYDPQTYSSYPGSPQGVPDLNIIPGLPSVSGYASIVNGNYESTTHTHEQDDLDIGQLSSGMLGRLNLREVVTVPEYFLVPLQAMPTSMDDLTQIPEGFGADPVLARGYGANFNDTAYPFDPGPRPVLASSKTASWFYGEPLEAATATLVLAHPAANGTEVRFGALRADGSTHWGAAVPVPAGAVTVSGHLPAGASIGLSSQVVAGALPAQRAVIAVDGHPYELAGSLSSALTPGPWQLGGFSQGYAVFTLRKPSEPIVASTATGRRLPLQILSSTTKSEQIRVQAPASTQVVRSVAWDSGWSATVSVNGGKAKDIPLADFDLVQQVHIPAGDDVVSFHYRPRHLLLASILSIGAIVLLLALLGVWLARLVRRRGSGREPDAAVLAEPPPEDSPDAVPERVG